jgi:hypothetical protein
VPSRAATSTSANSAPKVHSPRLSDRPA